MQFRVKHLRQPARILIDRWGIPHIRAESITDLFFAQGFNAARDRLWQIDLWRKRGLGRLAADFGPGYLAQDEAARLFLYRGDMEAEWRSYAEDAKAICTSFVAGINAFITAIERNEVPLPPEFTSMGTRPERWSAEDVVRIRSHGLTANAQSEIARSVLLAKAEDQADRLRQHREPDLPIGNPGQVDLASIPEKIIDLLKLASAPVSFAKARLAAKLEDAWRWSTFDDFGITRNEAPLGSNSWVVHGTRTKSGRPILASDPHRSLGLPSIRYIAHLSCPEIEVIGAGEPCVPGISIGHNERIAFGLTIFDADQEDVYVYETDPRNPKAYRHGDGWETMSEVKERFEVKGAPAQERILRFTRHGPVVFAKKNLAVAVRSVWGEPGSAPYLASLTTMRARNFAEFDTALARWKAPAVNKTYADIDGHIAWTPAGFVPRRSGWNGMLPVPGSGSFEWDGQLARAEMPRIFDPQQGFVATANEFNLPEDWDHVAKPVGFEWTESARAVRIKAMLARETRHELRHSQGLQTDIFSMPAARLLVVLDRLQLRDRQAKEARDMLAAWDLKMDSGSAAAALFSLWWSGHLRPAVVKSVTTQVDLLANGHGDAILNTLEAEPGKYASLIEDSLAAALSAARLRLGPEPAHWRWGDIHQMLFQHPVSADLNVGPFPLGGDASTPMHAGSRLVDGRITHGASVRLVMDVGDWDKSLCVNTPGQSGDPSSPHYADLAPIWAKGGYVPLLFSPAAIEEAIDVRIDLLPGDA